MAILVDLKIYAEGYNTNCETNAKLRIKEEFDVYYKIKDNKDIIYRIIHSNNQKQKYIEEIKKLSENIKVMDNKNNEYYYNPEDEHIEEFNIWASEMENEKRLKIFFDLE